MCIYKVLKRSNHRLIGQGTNLGTYNAYCT